MNTFNPKSKTHWLGAVQGALGGLVLFLPTGREFIPLEWYGPIFLVLGVVTVIIRNMTTTPIGEK